jgi:hypothetical protein
MASLASTSQGHDPNWYLDSGATDYITGELERLTTHDRYNGGNQIRTLNTLVIQLYPLLFILFI